MRTEKGRAQNHQENLKLIVEVYFNQAYVQDKLLEHLPESVHSETVVKSRTVAHEPSKGSFEDKTEVEGPVGHSLLDNRVTAGLGDDQISPLYNDNRDEVRGLAGILKNFSVGVGPFLSIGVLDVIVGTGIPLSTKLIEVRRPKSVVGHNPEIGEESSRGLKFIDINLIGLKLPGSFQSVHKQEKSDVRSQACHGLGHGADAS